MTMHDHAEWTTKLSDYLDAELPDPEQRAVAAHLADCAECARTLDELRQVAARAAALTATEPSTDLWHGIAGRIASTDTARPLTGPFSARRRFSFTWMELAAASVLLVLVTSFAVLRFTGRTTGRDVSAELPPQRSSGSSLSVQPRTDSDFQIRPASFDDTEYDAAVADLQRALESGRGELDPATITIVEDNLAIIDQAIEDARRALVEDPGNADLSGYLLETRRRKLNLLRHAAALSEDFN